MIMDSLGSRARNWRKQKVKITVFQIICFSTGYVISDPLFTFLWALSTVFVFMQVKAGFDTPIFNNILPFLYKSGMISIIYHKFSKSLTEIMPLSASYDIRIPWNNFNLNSEFSINWLFLFFVSVTKNCVIIFEKDLLFTRN